MNIKIGSLYKCKDFYPLRDLTGKRVGVLTKDCIFFLLEIIEINSVTYNQIETGARILYDNKVLFLKNFHLKEKFEMFELCQ